MKYIYFLLLLSFTTATSQEIEKNIFNNYEYSSKKDNFSAKLEKDIFNNIIYSDHNQNKITYENKYAQKYLPELFKDENFTLNFFSDLMFQYGKMDQYIQKYEIDIFGKEIIRDNRNNSTEVHTDIFGNYQYNDQYEGDTTKISQDLRGNWNFKRGNFNAILEKRSNNSYMFSDSKKNVVEINAAAFSRLKKKYGSEKEVFFFLLHNLVN